MIMHGHVFSEKEKSGSSSGRATRPIEDRLMCHCCDLCPEHGTLGHVHFPERAAEAHLNARREAIRSRHRLE